MRGLVLTLTSFALTAAVLGNAYVQKKQFYPSVVYITNSNPSLAVLYLQAFVFVVLMGKLFKKVFFGQLRAAEMEHLIERSWYAVTETCLAFTVFRDDFSPRFVAMFTLLLFLKCFHWLAEDRVDYMERSPVISWIFHVRVIMLFLVLGCLDFVFISFAYHSTLTKGASVQLVFGFEYAILLTMLVNVFFKYILHTIDLQSENPWENKAVYMLYTDLIMGFIKVFLYTAFVAIMIKIHTFPLFAIRPMYLAMRSFKKAVHDVIMSRRAIRNMNTLYPNATAEDLASTDNVCIICREEMLAPEAGAAPVGGGGVGACKKLPCNHIFHSSCLRSWFQRQQTCPTCRMDVLRLSAVAAASQRIQVQQAANAAGVPQANQQQNGQVPPRPDQAMPPFPAGFPFWMPQMPGGMPFGQPPPAPPTSTTTTTSATPATTTTDTTQAAAQGQASAASMPPFSGASLPSFPPSPAASGAFPGMFPSMMMPPFMMPFNVPPPLPPTDFSGLSDGELQAMEGHERHNVQARVECLRHIQLLLDAAVIQMQQYTNLIQRLGVPTVPMNLASTNLTSATSTIPTAKVQTTEPATPPQPSAETLSPITTESSSDLAGLEGAVGFTPSSNEGTSQDTTEGVEDEVMTPEEEERHQIRKRRLERLSNTPSPS